MGPLSAIDLMSPVSAGLLGALAAVAGVLFLLIRWGFGPPAANARHWGLLAIRATIILVLAALLANPVRVDHLPGSVRRPHVFYLVDASRSMALGDKPSRFEQTAATIRQAGRLLPREQRPALDVYRFGRRLAAVESTEADELLSTVTPADRDTQLLAALRQLTGRFAQTPPHAVVLFSDGRVRDPAGVEEMAQRYARMKVPIHVLPLGDAASSGDVAVLNMVAPATVRKYSQIDVWGWLRSYGYDGTRTEVHLSAVDYQGNVVQRLAQQPITLGSGIQPFHLTFRTDLQATRLQVSVPPQPDELSKVNNRATADVTVDRTKIRVLYIEGTMDSFVVRDEQGRGEIRSADYFLSEALSQDPDIECTARRTLQPAVSRSATVLPATRAALLAYDVILLSNVHRMSFRDEELEWIEEWIDQRGGGLCMVGGPQSFAAGGWPESVVGPVLPVVCSPAGNDFSAAARVNVRPIQSSALHPIWTIVSDAKQNLAILESLPAFRGTQRVLRAKPGASVIGVIDSADAQQDAQPAVVVGPYGKGRAMAMTTGIARSFAPEFVERWGEGDNRYYAKFWRNVIYWLSENSVNGRRRLIASTDKISYRPGETIMLQAAAYDEGANRTTNCRVDVLIEPQSISTELESDDSPVRWPEGIQERSSGEQGPYVVWGEEFEMARRPDREDYAVELQLVDASSPVAATQALRIELSAYEDFALIDSTSIDVQILDDPFEDRNPLPDLELLSRVASNSGGTVLSDANSLADVLGDLKREIGPPTVRKVPLWDRWWLIGTLVVLLTVEWIWRRSVGLA
ncbi:MAG: glutamine amidotransferase [Thermoguttaceae bacterium]